MFLDQYNIVTLEYHYYQNNCQYTYLNACDEHIDENGKLVDEDGEEVKHSLGTETYRADLQQYPCNAFERSGNINYVDSHNDIIKT